MKLKLRHAPFAAVALTLATLLAPTAAYAAPVDTTTTPDSICTWSGVDEETAICSPINYTGWASAVPAPASDVSGQLLLSTEAVGGPFNLGTATPSQIVSQGMVVGGEPFAVEPSDVANLPLSIRTGVGVNTFLPSGNDYEVQNFYATVVSPETWAEYGPKRPGINGVENSSDQLVSFLNPYEGLPGAIEQSVPAGTTLPVGWQPVDTASPVRTYDLQVPLASPTFTVRTNSTVNAVGYTFALTAQVRDVATGEIFNVQQEQLYSYYSAYSSDLQALAPTWSECEVTGLTICASGGAFSIHPTAYYTVESSTPPVVDPPVVEPPVVDPPTVEPPVVEPPAVEPPAVDAPETPEHPRVNAGDEFSLLGWFIPVVALLGVGVFLLVNRRGARA